MERIDQIGLAKPMTTGILKLPPLPIYGAGQSFVKGFFEADTMSLRRRKFGDAKRLRDAGRAALEGAGEPKGRLNYPVRWIGIGRRREAPII